MFRLELVLDPDEDQGVPFGDSLDLLERDLENALEYEWPARSRDRSPVFPALDGQEPEPDSMDLMEEFLARPGEGPGRAEAGVTGREEVPMATVNGFNQTEAPVAAANGHAGKGGTRPGWIYLAAESLVNYEALKGWGVELPAREEEAKKTSKV